MKKILIVLLLFFAISPQITFSQNIAISNIFQKRLDAILQQSLGNVQDYTAGVKGDVVERMILKEKDISLIAEIDIKTEIKPFWVVFFPDETIHLYDAYRHKTRVLGQFTARTKGEYRAELWDLQGKKVFHTSFMVNDIEKESEKKISHLYDSMNRARLLQKNAIMKYNILLQDIAIKKAIDMAEKSYIGHLTPYGEDIFSFAKDGNKKYSRLGENVAGGEKVTIETLYQGLLNSSLHHYAMIVSDWKEVGMAFVNYDNSQYLVQIFSD